MKCTIDLDTDKNYFLIKQLQENKADSYIASLNQEFFSPSNKVDILDNLIGVLEDIKSRRDNDSN